VVKLVNQTSSEVFLALKRQLACAGCGMIYLFIKKFSIYFFIIFVSELIKPKAKVL